MQDRRVFLNLNNWGKIGVGEILRDFTALFIPLATYKNEVRNHMSTEDPIETLVTKAQGGDREAFDELCRRFRSRLEHQIEARMGADVLKKLEAEDILQETLTCAFESLERFRYRDEESVYRWLAGIAEHVIWNISQKKSWNELQLVRDMPDAGPSPSKHVRRRERFERLEKALRNLSADHRKVLILARLEGRRVKEIASIMERSPNAVKKLLGRATLELIRSFGDTESLSLPDCRFRLDAEDGP